ncbi:MAG: undecaprenyl/decaprenyl-phosphate alpha-N-acetylglucosaminyl 1-phosphate transferase [Elusimicrobia bacterium]|nr:undecaprenyl/decaprenyl-phosphate alpha-N-acetylglucosaminyl 1-phosphate transferase [Elusimicrobiota bacterium]
MTRAPVALAAGLAASAALCPAVISLARRWGVLDLPGPRKVHHGPVPRMGGAAVLAGVLAAAAVRPPSGWGPEAGLLCGGLVVFLAGWWEDWRGLSPWSRLALQSAGAGLAVSSGLVLPVLGPLGPAVALLWLVGMANAFNFVDGLDGLAGGMGAASSALLWSLAGEGGVLSAGLCGACLGFLPYNAYRARTFLGDGGATFIGFLLAGLGILAGRDLGRAGLVIAAAVLALPLADLAFTTVSRVRRGEVRGMRDWVEFAGRDHLHHRLLEAGVPAPAASAILVAAHAAAAAVLLRLAG